MYTELQGSLVAGDHRFGLVVSRWNDFITSKLLSGALDALERHGARADNITVIRVPGSFELPQAARRCIMSGRFDAVVCLGCVIRGQTPHFEYIAAESTKGIAQVGLEAGRPVTFGVITADTLEQAIERAGSKAGNKGADAAITAIELLNLYEQIDGGPTPGAAK